MEEVKFLVKDVFVASDRRLDMTNVNPAKALSAFAKLIQLSPSKWGGVWKTKLVLYNLPGNREYVVYLNIGHFPKIVRAASFPIGAVDTSQIKLLRLRYSK